MLCEGPIHTPRDTAAGIVCLRWRQSREPNSRKMRHAIRVVVYPAIARRKRTCSKDATRTSPAASPRQHDTLHTTTWLEQQKRTSDSYGPRSTHKTHLQHTNYHTTTGRGTRSRQLLPNTVQKRSLSARQSTPKQQSHTLFDPVHMPCLRCLCWLQCSPVTHRCRLSQWLGGPDWQQDEVDSNTGQQQNNSSASA